MTTIPPPHKVSSLKFLKHFIEQTEEMLEFFKGSNKEGFFMDPQGRDDEEEKLRILKEKIKSEWESIIKDLENTLKNLRTIRSETDKAI